MNIEFYIKQFLLTIGDESEFNVFSLKNGKNNRVFKVSSKKRDYLLKHYYSDNLDTGNRLAHEFKFLEYAAKNGIDCVAYPYTKNDTVNLALYSFCAGREFSLNTINKKRITDACNFVIELNKQKKIESNFLPRATDSCFSIKQHLDSVENRIQILLEMNKSSEIHKRAFEFVSEVLYKKFAYLKNDILKKASSIKINPVVQLLKSEQIVSPSDFGFHNAMISENDRIFFFDFEYSGWDDPSKFVCDFFSQPAMPVDISNYDEFVKKVAELIKDPEIFSARTKLLLPLHQIKWCCIILNEFLQNSLKRRLFATTADEATLLIKQFNKAIKYYHKYFQEKDQMLEYIDFLSVVHKKTKRNYLARVNDLEYPKYRAAELAKKWAFDYWDGDRHINYGGYKYIEGRWEKVARAMHEYYEFKPGDKILDIGCGKGYLLYDFTKVIPEIEAYGVDISEYAVINSKEEVKSKLRVGNAINLPYPDNYFDFVYSLNTLHNLPCYDLEKSLREIERVGKKNKYICVESYRSEIEKMNLLYWQVTCEAFNSPKEWMWWFKHAGYTGDYSFIYFEQLAIEIIVEEDKNMKKYSQLKILHFKEKVESLPLEKNDIKAPIHVRIKPTNACNHNCWYCAYRSENLQLGEDMNSKDYIPENKMMEIIDDLTNMGVKAVTFSGGGEPFYYKYFTETIKKIIENKMQFASLTNGSKLSGEVAELFAHNASWLRVSMDACNDEDYAKQRSVKIGEFSTVISNLKSFIKLNGNCTLGVSLIINKQNYKYIYDFVKFLKEIGVHNVKLSPCIISNNGEENNQYHNDIFNVVKNEIERISTELRNDGFEVFDAYNQLESFEKDYNWCPFLQILPIIAADQTIYSCQDKAYTQKGMIGSIKNKSFKEFWNSDKNKFFRINPSINCKHHCVADSKNQIILDYLNVDKKHINFV